MAQTTKVTVKSGDTLSAIAKANNTSVAAIAAANPQITNLNKISVGQKVVLPTVTATKTSTNTYAGGVTGGANPFAAGSGVNTTTLAGINAASGFTTAGSTGGTQSGGGSNDGSGTGNGNDGSGGTNGKPAAGSILSTNTVDNGDGTWTTYTTYADGNGGSYTTTSTGGSKSDSQTGKDAIVTQPRTLAADTFKNTFALLFGSAEAAKSYVSKLYDAVSGFYKSGSTTEESINLAVRQAFVDKSMPEFTNRFSGLFTLMQANESGKAVNVPTVAEYIASENAIGDVLRNNNLGDLATQDYMNTILGAGNSVKEVTDKINTVFNRIDSASKEFKDAMQTLLPNTDRASLAKAILGGTDSVAQLQKKVETQGVMTAASAQGLKGLTAAQAGDIYGLGYTYENSMSKFGTAQSTLQGMDMLNQIYGSRYGNYGTSQALAQQFGLGNSAAADLTQKNLTGSEAANFSGSSGNLQSAYGVNRTAYGTSAAGLV